MESKLAEAWRAAAQDLGVRFVAPFELRRDDGTILSCTGLLPDFGSDNGVVIIGDDDPDEGIDIARDRGYYVTMMSDGSYGVYDPEQFSSTLNDWGWYGPRDQCPSWFRGRIEASCGAAQQADAADEARNLVGRCPRWPCLH
jgi:hypothetical protein